VVAVVAQHQQVVLVVMVAVVLVETQANLD
jgi:hypothetical protein